MKREKRRPLKKAPRPSSQSTDRHYPANKLMSAGDDGENTRI